MPSSKNNLHQQEITITIKNIDGEVINLEESFNFRLVQPNINQQDKWDKTKTLTNLNK